ncbi:DUF4485 domain-containing protein [Pseudoscourfieldia marina]
MQTAARLDAAFHKLCFAVERRMPMLAKSIRVRAAAWLERLSEPVEPVEWRRDRNNYARLLYESLKGGRIEPPFDRMPPQGPLPALPRWALYPFAASARGSASANNTKQTRKRDENDRWVRVAPQRRDVDELDWNAHSKEDGDEPLPREYTPFHATTTTSSSEHDAQHRLEVAALRAELGRAHERVAELNFRLESSAAETAARASAQAAAAATSGGFTPGNNERRVDRSAQLDDIVKRYELRELQNAGAASAAAAAASASAAAAATSNAGVTSVAAALCAGARNSGGVTLPSPSADPDVYLASPAAAAHPRRSEAPHLVARNVAETAVSEHARLHAETVGISTARRLARREGGDANEPSVPDVRFDRVARSIEAVASPSSLRGDANEPSVPDVRFDRVAGAAWDADSIAIGTPASVFPPRHPGASDGGMPSTTTTTTTTTGGVEIGAGNSSVDYVLGRMHAAAEATPSVALKAARAALAEIDEERRSGGMSSGGVGSSAPDDFLSYLRGFQTRTEELKRRFDYATVLHTRSLS